MQNSAVALLSTTNSACCGMAALVVWLAMHCIDLKSCQISLRVFVQLLRPYIYIYIHMYISPVVQNSPLISNHSILRKMVAKHIPAHGSTLAKIIMVPAWVIRNPENNVIHQASCMFLTCSKHTKGVWMTSLAAQTSF